MKKIVLEYIDDGKDGGAYFIQEAHDAMRVNNFMFALGDVYQAIRAKYKYSEKLCDDVADLWNEFFNILSNHNLTLDDII